MFSQGIVSEFVEVCYSAEEPEKPSTPRDANISHSTTQSSDLRLEIIASSLGTAAMSLKKRTLACLFSSDDEMGPAESTTNVPDCSSGPGTMTELEFSSAAGSQVPLPMAPWPDMLRSAFAGELKKIGQQTKQFQLATACSGTNAPALALQVTIGNACQETACHDFRNRLGLET